MNSDELVTTPPCVSAALEALLAAHEPDPTGNCLKTTEAIIRELDDMVELDTTTVANAMVQHGYSIVWHPNGRHGWAVKLLV